MKCLLKYKWVKLPREILINDKGIMSHYMKLSSRAAFRKGIATYCGYENSVEPGMWAGGIVGVKSILGIKGSEKAYDALDVLEEMGYVTYTLNWRTKKLTYRVTDWVRRYSNGLSTQGCGSNETVCEKVCAVQRRCREI